MRTYLSHKNEVKTKTRLRISFESQIDMTKSLAGLASAIVFFGALQAWAGPSDESSTSPPRPKKVSLATDINALRPQIGIQLFASPYLINNQKANGFFTQNGFKGELNSQVPPNPSISAAGILIDYQPEFLQYFGAVDLGLSFALNPLLPVPNTYINRTAMMYTIGIQAKYQLRLYPGQPIVPVVGYYADRFNYYFAGSNNTGSEIKGTSYIHGPILGAWLLLNWIEPSTARDLWINTGPSRSYLTFEARWMRSTGTSSFSVNGISFFYGLRIEI
jgi:hypothetical protein